ncbi:insulinase (peptidase family M16) [Clostridium saccharobutylicum]|uniref:M16 family metallopeptidase n=1 Tax=Clostridium saccharobutylicum TaxID=169679 RepID=UPI000983E781|nr:pitrilysin family protein [Clostridium saccharobutylicum]AQS11628.1 insulinase (peptidase family M16) [Clostridium saccharobutylicum]MBC2435015.1 insulinase family protein [Clostridium saccharobutylicum]NSB86729.1 putative Zn-dependent peptidase [Clostridium saccharobutylicum]NYC30374.1 putative Zn-dependent peptidase [Clostridium saccharobutylicum]OOM12547.1 insulinase [Clostridium saccharobutylicum]
MQEYIFENNFKLIYKHTDSELTSICISIDAGAGVENEKYGVAHATEHMVYKGTRNRTEKQINEDLTNVFGFNNAMTNYPYVIYYGTLLGPDLEKGLELLSDIIINPTFGDDGFKEEMDVIKQELEEWDEELEQYCEDKLFFNCFNSRRIKYPIIGTKNSLESMTLSDIKKFYNKYYFPQNTSIVVISSREFEKVKYIINKYFGQWKVKLDKNDGSNKLNCKKIEYEYPKVEVLNNKRNGIKTCRVEIICPIDNLTSIEMKSLRIFNQYFGEGVNSLLYDILRTENGLIYDVITKIANENYIKLYKITFNTAKQNVDKAISLIKECIGKVELSQYHIDRMQMEQLIKSFKLKRLFREEQSIVLAKELATYDSMFGDYKIYIDEINGLDELTEEMIFEVGKKVLKNLSIQIIEVCS